jgi:AIPR protein
MLDLIRREISSDHYYGQNFPNDGQRFVAWYLRRVLLRSPEETRQDITDGANDKQIDAIIVDDENRKIIVIQGKFIGDSTVDAEPLREVLSAWLRLRELDSLQKDANEKLRERLEAVRRAIDDEYELEFELLTTGRLTTAAEADLESFSRQMSDFEDFPVSFQLVDTEVITTRLAEAESKELPVITHQFSLSNGQHLQMNVRGTRSIIAALPLRECLTIPGIIDGRLFRKNVRQSLGQNNKVNKGLRQTLEGERIQDFFFYHNGITALCKRFTLDEKSEQLTVHDLSVVNGCQSLTTIHSCSESVRKHGGDDAYILFRFYEIPQRDLADKISVYTNSQSAVKSRDLRSNDRSMLSLKRAYESIFRDGFFITQRGAQRPADRDAEKTVDCSDFAKAIMAWHCQRPNISYNERRLFDEYYKLLFRPDYDPKSVLALQNWMNAIERSWANLLLNEALKAGKSYVKFHILYAISSLIAHASGQGDKVPYPSATLELSTMAAADILPLAVNCVNKAMEQANTQSQLSNRVFSPQNWCKALSSVQGETLVASTIIGMMPGLGAGDMISKIKINSDAFGLRWSAE